MNPYYANKETRERLNEKSWICFGTRSKWHKLVSNHDITVEKIEEQMDLIIKAHKRASWKQYFTWAFIKAFVKNFFKQLFNRRQNELRPARDTYKEALQRTLGIKTQRSRQSGYKTKRQRRRAIQRSYAKAMRSQVRQRQTEFSTNAGGGVE